MKSDDARDFAALIDWLRDKLERLHAAVDDGYVQRNLHALIRACDPDTNPRLRATLGDERYVDLLGKRSERDMRPLDRQRAITEYKRRRRCRVCGKRRGPRELLLVRPDGSGMNLSRIVSRRSLDDRKFWEEVRRRIVVCRTCYLGGRVPPR